MQALVEFQDTNWKGTHLHCALEYRFCLTLQYTFLHTNNKRMNDRVNAQSHWNNSSMMLRHYNYKIKKRLQMGPQTRTHSVICGNKDKRHFPFLRWLCEHTGTFSAECQHNQNSQQFSLVPEPQMDVEGHSFTHSLCVHTYTLITIMNGARGQSVITNKMNLWTEHVFRVRLQRSATQSGSSRQRGGQIRKDSRLKRQLRRCHYACLPSKGPYPPPRRQKQCLLFYLATGV